MSCENVVEPLTVCNHSPPVTRVGLAGSRLVRAVIFFLTALFVCVSQQVRAQTTSEEQTNKELRRALAQRDALVDNLLRRVEQLEERVGVSSSAARVAPKPSARPAPRERPSPERQARAESAPADARPAGPGAFDVDEKAAERALERTLTAAGALLLPAGGVELQTGLSYSRTVRDSPTLFSAQGVILTGRDAELRLNEFDFSLGMQVGLPFDSQFELSIPYQIVDREVLVPEGQAGFEKDSETATAFGDLRVGIAKTFFREKGWRPDLIGRVTWDTDTGKQTAGNVALGGGFNELRFSLTTVKRQDPLVFTAGLSYEKAFKKNNVEPGDEYGLSLGVTLAASPETALSASLQQTFSNEDKINGRKITGSDRVSSALVLGASTIVGRGLLVSLTPGIGLTDDAPDYFVSLFGTKRFR